MYKEIYCSTKTGWLGPANNNKLPEIQSIIDKISCTDDIVLYVAIYVSNMMTHNYNNEQDAFYTMFYI